MSDQKNPSEEPIFVAGASVADDEGVLAEGALAAQGDHAVVIARFANPDAAQAVYQSLRDGESSGGYHVDGVLVANADDSGKVRIQKMTDHTSRNGLAWGAVAGAVIGLIFPPTILASAATLGAAGLVAGKVGNVLKKSAVADSLTEVITPGTSGIVALVALEDVEAVEKEMPEATAVKSVPVDDETANAIKAASATAEAAGVTESA